MRDGIQKVLLLAVASSVLAACSDKNLPVDPQSATPIAARGTPKYDGFIVVLKSSQAFDRVRVGARVGTVVPGINRAAANLAVADVVPLLNAFVVRGVASAADLAGPDVAEVVPNYEVEIIEPVPLDPSMVISTADDNAPLGTDQSAAAFFAANYQWNYKKISANRAWVPSRGGAGANVCIIDSGIDPGHASFIGKSIVSTSFVPNSSAQTDSNGHGSHVAGIVSTNGALLASVAPNANLMTAKVFNISGSGSTTAVWNGIIWCTDNGADVINMSLGIPGGVPTTPGNQPFIDFYQVVLDYATSAGVLIVAAAGNDGGTLPVAGRRFIPAEMGGVTSVAATAPTTNLSPFGPNPIWSAPGAAFDGIASYSNRGGVPSIDISAPGGDLFAGWPAQSLIISVCSRQTAFGAAPFTFPCSAGNSGLFEAGTSQASPHVAGVAALIRGRWPSSGRSPTLRNKIEACLYRSIDNVGPTTVFGRGRVNAYKAATQPC